MRICVEGGNDATATKQNNTMKILLTVDQRASLIAGLDAPNSTITLDISPADIATDDRVLIMPHYDVVTGRFSGAPDVDRAGAGWPDLPNVHVPDVLSNATVQDALTVLHAYADSLRARQAAYDAALAAHRIARTERERQEQAEAAILAASRAACIAGVVVGTHQIVSDNGDNVIIACPNAADGEYDSDRNGVRAVRVPSCTPEIAGALAAFRAAKQAEADARATAAAEAAEQKKLRQINGYDLLSWPVDGGTIDQTTAVGIPYDSHRNVRNWIATVEHDAKSPSKLDRKFWDGKPSAREIPMLLSPGDYIEGASKDKKGRSNYNYYRVLEITPTALIVRESGTPAKAPKPIDVELARLAEIRALPTVD